MPRRPLDFQRTDNHATHLRGDRYAPCRANSRSLNRAPPGIRSFCARCVVLPKCPQVPSPPLGRVGPQTFFPGRQLPLTENCWVDNQRDALYIICLTVQRIGATSVFDGTLVSKMRKESVSPHSHGYNVHVHISNSRVCSSADCNRRKAEMGIVPSAAFADLHQPDI